MQQLGDPRGAAQSLLSACSIYYQKQLTTCKFLMDEAFSHHYSINEGALHDIFAKPWLPFLMLGVAAIEVFRANPLSDVRLALLVAFGLSYAFYAMSID